MSTLAADTISDAAGTGPAALTGQWASKASVKYDQIAVSVDASDNASSVDDIATGRWGLNFTNAMAAATYRVVMASHSTGFNAQANGSPDKDGTTNTSGFDTDNGNTVTAALADLDTNNAVVFGDLA